MSKPAARVTLLGHGMFSVERGDGAQTLAYGVADGENTWVFIDGITYVAAPPRQGRIATAHDRAALAAPMPATVTHIHVAPGQAVARGDALLTLEAMKMELPICATADGTVTAINCRVGELVQPGIPLVEVLDAVPGQEPPGSEPPGPETGA